VASSSSPVIRRTRLGSELRRLREQAGLTCEAVGRQLECSGTRVSRLETGRISVRPGDVRELLDLYGVAGREVGDLVQLAREVRRKGWWHAYSRVVPPWFGSYLGLESEAAGLRDFQPLSVPALLQTEEYARVVLRAAPDAGPGDPAARRVALRMRRQAILARPSAPGLCVVIGEGALRAQTGGTAIMRAQLARLAGLAGRPAITLQVLPLRSGADADPVPPFTILDFRDGADRPVVYLEHLTGGVFLDGQDDIARYDAAFGQLCARALAPAESAALIARLARDWPRSRPATAPGAAVTPEMGLTAEAGVTSATRCTSEAGITSTATTGGKPPVMLRNSHNAARSGVRVLAVSGRPDPARYSAVSSSKRPPR